MADRYEQQLREAIARIAEAESALTNVALSSPDGNCYCLNPPPKGGEHKGYCIKARVALTPPKRETGEE